MQTAKSWVKCNSKESINMRQFFSVFHLLPLVWWGQSCGRGDRDWGWRGPWKRAGVPGTWWGRAVRLCSAPGQTCRSPRSGWPWSLWCCSELSKHKLRTIISKKKTSRQWTSGWRIFRRIQTSNHHFKCQFLVQWLLKKIEEEKEDDHLLLLYYYSFNTVVYNR